MWARVRVRLRCEETGLGLGVDVGGQGWLRLVLGVRG